MGSFWLGLRENEHSECILGATACKTWVKHGQLQSLQNVYIPQLPALAVWLRKVMEDQWHRPLQH